MRVPYRKGGFFYYSRTEQGKQYPIYCRKRGQPGGAREVVTLDLNALAEGREVHGPRRLHRERRRHGSWPSPTDDTGFRQYTLYVKDLATGDLLPLRARRSARWPGPPTTRRSSTRSRRSRPSARTGSTGTAWATAEHDLVYEETDEAFNIGVGRTRSRALPDPGHRQPHDVRGARSCPRTTPAASGRSWPRASTSRSTTSTTTATTSTSARTTRAATSAWSRRPVVSPGRENWQEVVPHRPDVMLEGIDLFQHHSVALRARGRPAPAPRHGPRAPAQSHRRRLPGARVLGLPRREPRVRHHGLPLQLPVAGDAELRLRLRHGRAHERRC